MQAILSFDKAPPFSVPARFFLAAPLFGMLAGLLLLWEGEAIVLSRWSPAALALTHLFTVGFMLQIMIGALFQILPVVAGANTAHPLFWARVLHAPLNLGALGLAAGFWLAQPMLLLAGGSTVIVVIAVFLVVAGRALWQIPPTSPTIPAIKFALGGLMLTALLGAYLLAVFALGVSGRAGMATAQHAAWGLIGWAGVLVAGVSFIVVPMFQLTPPYRPPFARRLAPLLVALLLLWTVLQALAAEGQWTADALPLAGSALALVLAAFAVKTLYLQHASKRPRPDASFRFWQVAMLMACVALIAWVLQLWLPHLPLAFLIGVAAMPGAIASVMAGMLSKILPFLAWLHVQNRSAQLASSARRRLPHMGSYLSEGAAWRHFWLHVAALLLLLGTGFDSALASTAGAAMFLAYAALGWNLLSIVRRFRATRDGLGAIDTAA